MRKPVLDVPFTLFSFQDIITSVTGILILITLLLALDTIVRSQAQAVPAMSASSTAPSPGRRKEAAVLRTEIAALKAALEQSRDITAKFAGRSRQQVEDVVRGWQSRRAQLQREVEDAKRDIASAERETAEAARQDPASSTSRLEELRRAVDEAEAKLELAAQGRLVTYHAHPGQQKQAWGVDISAREIHVFRLGDRQAANSDAKGPGSQGVAAFLTWAVTRPSAQEYFFLIVRPDGLDNFERIWHRLRDEGYDVGIDVVRQDVVLLRGEANGSSP